MGKRSGSARTRSTVRATSSTRLWVRITTDTRSPGSILHHRSIVPDADSKPPIGFWRERVEMTRPARCREGAQLARVTAHRAPFASFVAPEKFKSNRCGSYPCRQECRQPLLHEARDPPV